MKILILYSSGTGNTKFACQVAKIVMERAGHEVTMKTYKKAAGERLGEHDAFCFAAPVYEWAPARNVEQFVGSMPRLEGKCAFMLTSSAGAKGQATELFATMLKKKGLTVLGDYNFICPDSWGGTRRWSYTEDEASPTVESVRELAAFVEKMLSGIDAFLDGKHVRAPSYRVRPTGLYWASRFSRLAPSARAKMGKKKVDEAACTECRVCEKNCPVGAITLDPYPVFSRECIACWSCINMCPTDCITTAIDSRRHYKGIARRDELLKKAGLEL
jgi:ferredoxin/flavodoxin